MSRFLDWYTQHNAFVIQLLAAILAVLLVALLIKVFLGSKEDVSSVEGFEKKLNQLLEGESGGEAAIQLQDQQSHDQSVEQVASQPMVEAQTQKKQELAQQEIKSETEKVATNQVEAQSQETEVSSVETEQQQSVAEPATVAAVEPVATATVTNQEVIASEPASAAGSNSEDIQAYRKQVEDLQRRLSDYEVVADDIAELKNLKLENENLKKEIEELKSKGS